MLTFIATALLAAEPSPVLEGIPLNPAENCRFWALPNSGGNLVCVQLKRMPELPEGRFAWEWHAGDPLKEQVGSLEEMSGGKAEPVTPCKLAGKSAECRTLKVGSMTYRFAQRKDDKAKMSLIVRCEFKGDMPAFCARFLK